MPLPTPLEDDVRTASDGEHVDGPNGGEAPTACAPREGLRSPGAAASMKKEPDWLKAAVTSDGVTVDRENAIIYGYVVAQEGPFKSEGRGEFDRKSLQAIVKLMKGKPNGLKVRFGHPTESDDGLSKFLGRARKPRMDRVRITRDGGEVVALEAVRADLHLDPTSFKTPSGDIGGYIIDRAETDPDSFSTSLVLKAEREYRIEKNGTPKKDADGNELPPLWRPVALHASDVVDTGDAVDGFLSAEGLAALPDGVVRQATALLDRQFAGQDRQVIEARCTAWLQRYLAWKFGPVVPADEPTEPPTPKEDEDISQEIPEAAAPYDPAADPLKLRIRRRRRRAS